jgi:hypothetical protein
MDGASKSMLSLSTVHYHPERDEPLLKEHAELQNGRKFVVSTTPDHGSNVLIKKISRPLQRLLKTVNSLGFGYVMFSPNGKKMDHLFPAFPEEWEDVAREPKEYRIIGEVSLEANSPEEAASEFVEVVQDGKIVVTVQNANTDSVFDVHLKDLEDTGGTSGGDSADADEGPGTGGENDQD